MANQGGAPGGGLNREELMEAFAMMGDGFREDVERALLANGGAPGGGAGAAVAAGQQRITDEEMRGANPLLMLLRSLLPWVAAGEAPDYDADDAAAVAAAGGAGGGGEPQQQEQQQEQPPGEGEE